MEYSVGPLFLSYCKLWRYFFVTALSNFGQYYYNYGYLNFEQIYCHTRQVDLVKNAFLSWDTGVQAEMLTSACPGGTQWLCWKRARRRQQ